MSEAAANYNFINELSIKDNVDRKASILKFESALMESEKTIELQVFHHRSPGIYARTIIIPAGVALTGKIHMTEHLCVVCGDIEIADHQGYKRLTGYHIIHSEQGIKRCGFAHEDTAFTTIHAVNDDMSIEEIENLLCAETHQEYEYRRLN